jgi:hypothetical protein
MASDIIERSARVIPFSTKEGGNFMFHFPFCDRAADFYFEIYDGVTLVPRFMTSVSSFFS